MRNSPPVRWAMKRALLGLAALLVAIPFAAHAVELGMLDGLAKGTWNLRIRDDGSEQRITETAVAERQAHRHKQAGCSRFVVRDEANEVVVQYTCRGNGYGRTSIRREGNGLVQVQSQGVIDGAPFSISGEARHNGAC